MIDVTRYKDFTWVMDSSRSSSWQTEPLHWTWMGPKNSWVLHDSPLIVNDLRYSYKSNDIECRNFLWNDFFSACPTSRASPFRVPVTLQRGILQNKLVVLLFHALCSLLIHRSCCYDVQFFAFITDDKSAGCDLWNAWWDPSERKVGETATSLQPEGNASVQPSNSSIWSLRSQHDWSKENRKYIMWSWYQMIDVGEIMAV